MVIRVIKVCVDRNNLYSQKVGDLGTRLLPVDSRLGSLKFAKIKLAAFGIVRVVATSFHAQVVFH